MWGECKGNNPQFSSFPARLWTGGPTRQRRLFSQPLFRASNGLGPFRVSRFFLSQKARQRALEFCFVFFTVIPDCARGGGRLSSSEKTRRLTRPLQKRKGKQYDQYGFFVGASLTSAGDHLLPVNGSPARLTCWRGNGWVEGLRRARELWRPREPVLYLHTGLAKRGGGKGQA